MILAATLVMAVSSSSLLYIHILEAKNKPFEKLFRMTGDCALLAHTSITVFRIRTVDFYVVGSDLQQIGAWL